MKFTPLIWSALIAQLSCGCHQQHHYEKSPLAAVVPGPEVQSWISPKDLPEVAKRASEGNLECTVMLAHYYLDTVKDRETGMRWLRAAATKGDRASEWNLIFYLLRSADQSEQAEGIKWLRAAAKDGDEMAIRELRRWEKESNQPSGPTAVSSRGSG